MNTKRLERLLKLIQALQSGRSQTADDLSEAVGVSRRTVFRDLELLTRAGIPYTFDRKTRRYSIVELSYLPPVRVTHAEALALLMATRHMLGHAAMVDRTAAASAGMKIECMLPQAIRDHCGSIAEHIAVRFDPASDPASVVDAMPALQLALIRRTKIGVRYDSYYDGKIIDVVLHPYQLLYCHRGWYVVAYAEPFAEVRTFKIERMLQLKLLERAYAVDPAFNLEDYLGNAWLMIRGDTRYHVRIRFLKKVAGNVAEIRWHKTQRTAFTDDGSLNFEVDVDGIDEIAWWVLGYGDQAEVLEPPELRVLIANHARRMLGYYDV